MRKFEFWLSQYPESHHALDEKRFYDFAEKIAETDESIDTNWLQKKLEGKEHRMSADQVGDYSTRLKNIVAFLRDRRSL